MRPILFLDVDGVLNDHVAHANGYCGMLSRCVRTLNAVIRDTDCDLVLCSSWRYLVHSGSMNLAGLENLFLTHGLNVRGRLVGVTGGDAPGLSRGRQVLAWLEHSGGGRPFAVLDDQDGGDISDTSEGIGLRDEAGTYAALGLRWVAVDGSVGLTPADWAALLMILAPKATAKGVSCA